MYRHRVRLFLLSDTIVFISMIVANRKTFNVCLLNEISTEVDFAHPRITIQNDTQQQWIEVDHYYPYRQLTTVQSETS